MASKLRGAGGLRGRGQAQSVTQMQEGLAAACTGAGGGNHPNSQEHIWRT